LRISLKIHLINSGPLFYPLHQLLHVLHPRSNRKAHIILLCSAMLFAVARVLQPSTERYEKVGSASKPLPQKASFAIGRILLRLYLQQKRQGLRSTSQTVRTRKKHVTKTSPDFILRKENTENVSTFVHSPEWIILSLMQLVDTLLSPKKGLNIYLLSYTKIIYMWNSFSIVHSFVCNRVHYCIQLLCSPRQQNPKRSA
jgi:hypothetical protein